MGQTLSGSGGSERGPQTGGDSRHLVEEVDPKGALELMYPERAQSGQVAQSGQKHQSRN